MLPRQSRLCGQSVGNYRGHLQQAESGPVCIEWFIKSLFESSSNLQVFNFVVINSIIDDQIIECECFQEWEILDDTVFG